MVRSPPLRSDAPFWWLAAVVLLLFFAGGAIIVVFSARDLRCYKIARPLTSTERQILTGKLFECAETVCRTKLSLGEAGMACYFNHAPGSAARLAAALTTLRPPASAAQRSSAHSAYRTTSPS